MRKEKGNKGIGSTCLALKKSNGGQDDKSGEAESESERDSRVERCCMTILCLQ